MSCPPIPIGDNASLTATLSSLDCQVNGAVTSGYAHLFGAGGAFGFALTAGLTIYLAILALGLLTGHTRLTLPALGPKVLILGFVLTFATAWPAYQAVVYDLLTGGPDQVASAFMGGKAGATQAFAARLDVLFNAVLDSGRQVAALPKAPNLELASKLIWTSAVLLMLATMGLLVVARLVLAVLLALGPIFIVFGLFSGTRGLFEGWLRTSVAFAFGPMLIVLGGSGLMAVLAPVIGSVAADPGRAVAELRPVITLFLASIIYAGLIVTLMGTAMALTRGWRIPLSSSPQPSQDPLVGSTPAMSLAASGSAVSAVLLGSDDRVAGLTATILREGTRGASRRALPFTEGSPVPVTGVAPDRRGLGQSFRPAPRERALTGPIA